MSTVPSQPREVGHSPAMPTADGLATCRESIAHHSKSFALASRLLPGDTRDHAAIVYAFCRRADDAIDGVPKAAAPAAVHRLRAELDAVYRGGGTGIDELDAFAAVVAARAIPREYPEELLAGMQMDSERSSYASLDELLLYCHRVAGVVGLMMCHVMGVADPAARRHAAHLGIAMQLTNICRDVLEDWQLGRLYLNGDLLAECGAPGLADHLGSPFPREFRAAVGKAVASTLDLADGFYRSGDRGLASLSWRCALAVGSARRVYHAIGQRVRSRGCDVTAGRAFVGRSGKLRHVAAALLQATVEWPGRAASRRAPVPLAELPALRFPADILPFPS